MKIDYRELLVKYIAHVGQCEGITFIDRVNEGMHSDVPFTDGEVIELQLLDEESEKYIGK